ncbi:hypothetical protein E2C01_071026 [Portunus trituberculatus]|uniref:Uncharacterized protein n=1 Tax=Portunus trituberculatus TaxID=210409 RepID=A0A5B7I448_PORTR|nr:hypothetical protein [Portunus trituberculatus]
MTTTQNGNLEDDAFTQGLLELRIAPHGDGRSPSQVLFGHPLRSSVPTHYRSFAEEWQKAAAECDSKAVTLHQQAKDRYDARSRTHSQLFIGTHVDVFNHTSNRWDRHGVIVAIGSRRDYLVKLGSGRTWWRNRRFLRPHRPFLTSATTGEMRFGCQRREPSRLTVHWDKKSHD